MITVRKRPKPYPKSKQLDLQKVLELFINNNELGFWWLQDGSVVLIKNLRKSHIINILDFMSNRPYWRADQRPYLEAELKRREIIKLSKKTKSGKLLYADV